MKTSTTTDGDYMMQIAEFDVLTQNAPTDAKRMVSDAIRYFRQGCMKLCVETLDQSEEFGDDSWSDMVGAVSNRVRKIYYV